MISDPTGKNYPKVLIIGQSFNLQAGGGITKANLFKGWPQDKIAVATESIDHTGIEYCKHYYRLGYEETKRPWPFNLFQPKYKSYSIQFDQAIENNPRQKHNLKKSKYPVGLKKLMHATLHFFGIYTLIFRIRISTRFMDWFNEYNPDIVYTQLAKLEYNNFMYDLMKVIDVPLAIHIMDDWPKTINQPGILYPVLKRINDRKFQALIDKASITMGICEAMNIEYKERYGRNFMPFHNTIDWDKWKLVAKTDYNHADLFKILYAGRIGLGTSKSIFTLLKAIKIIVDDGMPVEFQIQSKDIDDKIRKELKQFSFVRINEFLPYEQLPAKFAEVDLLVLPMDFTKSSLRFIHLSMPTKVPEYMASGTPILVFAHKSTALFKYAYTAKWAYTISNENIHQISNSITELCTNQRLRKSIGKKAVQTVQDNHDGKKVREEFKKALISCLN